MSSAAVTLVPISEGVSGEVGSAVCPVSVVEPSGSGSTAGIAVENKAGGHGRVSSNATSAAGAGEEAGVGAGGAVVGVVTDTGSWDNSAGDEAAVADVGEASPSGAGDETGSGQSTGGCGSASGGAGTPLIRASWALSSVTSELR